MDSNELTAQIKAWLENEPASTPRDLKELRDVYTEESDPDHRFGLQLLVENLTGDYQIHTGYAVDGDAIFTAMEQIVTERISQA